MLLILSDVQSDTRSLSFRESYFPPLTRHCSDIIIYAYRTWVRNWSGKLSGPDERIINPAKGDCNNSTLSDANSIYFQVLIISCDYAVITLIDSDMPVHLRIIILIFFINMKL